MSPASERPAEFVTFELGDRTVFGFKREPAGRDVVQVELTDSQGNPEHAFCYMNVADLRPAQVKD